MGLLKSIKVISLVSMSMNDLVSDYVARINNAVRASHTEVVVLKNNLIMQLTKKLVRLKFVDSFIEEGYYLRIKLLPKSIAGIKKLSKPGQRQYASYKNLPRVVGGVGFNLLTTSRGIKTHIEAMEEKIGGELLLQIYR